MVIAWFPLAVAPRAHLGTSNRKTDMAIDTIKQSERQRLPYLQPRNQFPVHPTSQEYAGKLRIEQPREDPPAMNFIALRRDDQAEFFVEFGRDVLIVYDD